MNVPNTRIMADGMTFDLVNILGRGEYAEVWAIQPIDPVDEQMAAKVFKSHIKKSISDNEITCMKLIGEHPNIVKLKHVFHTTTHTYIIQEKIVGRELFEAIIEAWELDGCGTEGLPENVAAKYFSQLASAIIHMHSKGVSHRDIKPENILIENTDSVKLVDFGLSSTNRISSTRCGTLDYMAPEVVNSDPNFDTFPVDVWACGIVLFAMLTGRLPFSGTNDGQLKRSIIHDRVRFPVTVSPRAQDLIRELLNPNPLLRISLEDAHEHPFITQFTET